nr:hypothetical protein [Lelliottia sp. WAP21]
MMFVSTGAEAPASAPAILPPASPWRAAVAAWMPRCTGSHRRISSVVRRA